MTSRTSCFNGTLFRKNLGRFWPLWVGYALLLILVQPVRLSSTYFGTYASPEYCAAEAIYGNLCSVTPVFVFCMAPLTAMAVFGFLYKSKSCDAFCALPMNRRSLFCTAAVSGLVPMVAAPVLTALLTLAVAASGGYSVTTPLLTWLGITLLDTVTFYGFAVLCAQLTGALLVLPAVYAVLQFTAVGLELLADGYAGMFLYGFRWNDLSLKLFSPMVELLTTRRMVPEETQVLFYGWHSAAIYALVGAVFLALGFVLFRHRAMERAGDFVAVRPLKPVFKYLLGLGCGLCFGLMDYLFFGTDRISAVPVIVSAMAGGFIGYFGAEMLMRKTFRVFGKTWKGGIVMLAVMALLVCSFVFDFYGYGTFVPKAETIQSVELNVMGTRAELTEYEDLELMSRIQKEINDTCADPRISGAVPREERKETLNVTLDYTLRNGRRIGREYYGIPYTEKNRPLFRDLEQLLNGENALRDRLLEEKLLKDSYRFEGNVDCWNSDGERCDNIQLSHEEALELYRDCILPDAWEGTIARVALSEDSPYTAETAKTSIYINAYEEKTYSESGKIDYNDYHWLQFRPTVNSRHTNAWLSAHGIPWTPEVEYRY